MTSGALHCLLKNAIYLGEIVHREKVYPGQHQPIMERDLFDRVQAKLAIGAPALPDTKRRNEAHKLLGLWFDNQDNPMTSDFSRSFSFDR